MPLILEITAEELADKKTAGEKFFLLDVREQSEADFCKIDGGTLIPLGELPARLGEVPKDLPIVAYCHHGGRSRRALQFLKTQGFTALTNLVGGIDAWAVDVDSETPRY